MELEGPDSPGIQLFRDSGGPGLLVPIAQRGRGATALDALRVQRALGSRTPSLAVATILHHFSVATLVGLSTTDDGQESMLVAGVAAGNQLVAFGFAEERPGAGILSPMTATAGPDGLSVSGRTRPCSLARSMDVLAVSVMVPGWGDDGGEVPAVALVSAESEGVSVGGAGVDSEQVTLDDVLVPPELLVQASAPDGRPEVMLAAGFAWFQLLMTGGYLGAASALVERVLLDNRVPESERVRLLVEAEGVMSAAGSTTGTRTSRRSPTRCTSGTACRTPSPGWFRARSNCSATSTPWPPMRSATSPPTPTSWTCIRRHGTG
ncbi:hypothetical protein AB0L65_48800 [Nonomuraea sp. NPDC052116]|uniref:hypothetical protein n=1 Tax=Nonomuraea sp. NPDC052116 TaxID=3155665 RepID=UPI0034183A24